MILLTVNFARATQRVMSYQFEYKTRFLNLNTHPAENTAKYDNIDNIDNISA